MGGRIRGADHAQGDEWREQVGDVEVRIVEEECGEVAEQLGYGRLTDTAPSHQVGADKRRLRYDLKP